MQQQSAFLEELKAQDSLSESKETPIQGSFTFIDDKPTFVSNNHEAAALLSTTSLTATTAASGRVCSIDVVHNRIRIDRGLFLAPEPNIINDHWSMGYKGGIDLVNVHCEGLKRYMDLDRFSKKYRDLLNVLLANLLNAKNTNSQLLYSRNTAGNVNHILMRVIDYLESEKLVVNVIGKANEFEGNQSWLIPTEKLILELAAARVRVELLKNASMIVLRDKDGVEKRINTGKRAIALAVKRLSLPVQLYNKMWLGHSITFTDNHLVPFCRRIFNKSLDLGGRFYGTSVQTMSKAQREQILIDGEKTAEPDFKSIHYCLLYAEEGIELNPLENDPYLIEGFSRDTAKLASLVLMNSENIGSFKANLTKSGNPDIKRAMREYQVAYELFIKRSSQGLSTSEPKKPLYAKGFIEGMPDNIRGAELYDSITARHAAIAHHFGTKDIGLRLQYQDSQIMGVTLRRLAEHNIPAIPVHDSLRCKASDLDAVTGAMKTAYLSVTGLNAIVTH